MEDREKTKEQLIVELGQYRGRMAEMERAHDELQASLEEMAVADEITRILNSTLDIAEVYEQFAQELSKLVDFDRAAVNLVDADRGIINIKHMAGSRLATTHLPPVRQLSGSQTEAVITSGRSVIRSDIQADFQFSTDPIHLQAGLRSVIMVPLFSQGIAVGVLSLRSARVGAYSDRERFILERLTGKIAAALINAELYETSREEQRQAANTSAQLSAVLEGVDAGLLLVGEDRQVLWMNQRFGEFFGVANRPEENGEPQSISLDWLRERTRGCFADPDAYYADLDRIYPDPSYAGVVGDLELQYPRQRILREFTAPILDAEGGYVGRLWVSTDVTEGKRAEEELKRTTGQLSLLLESLPVIIYTCRAQGDYGSTYISSSVHAITGYQPEDFTADSAFWINHVHPEDLPRVLEGLPELFAKGCLEHEYRFRISDGSYRWFGDMLRLVHAEDGTVSHCAGTWQDITDRRQSEDSLREATERIQQQTQELILTNADLTTASQAKSDFLSHMSHELRTPLNAALGFARLIQEPSFGQLNEKQQRFADNIVTSCVHLLQLINDIIDISKIEAGKTDLAPQRLDVRECLVSCYNIAAGMAANKGIDLRVSNPPDGTVIVADDTKLKQIILNLLSNAIKFTPEGGEVLLSATAADGDLRILVRDSGIGISPEYQQQIFELFNQGAPEVSRAYGGSGLGLSLVKELVTLQGGRVGVTSEPGQGSTFTVDLPIGSSPLLDPRLDSRL